MKQINEENYFEKFYFDINSKKEKEIFFELDGNNYTFVNVHQEKLDKISKSSLRKTSLTNVSTNLLINKFNDNVTSLNHTSNHVVNRSNSVTIYKKILI